MVKSGRAENITTVEESAAAPDVLEELNNPAPEYDVPAPALVTMSRAMGRSFVRAAILFEGGLGLAAAAIAWQCGVAWWNAINWSPIAVVQGLAACLPMFAVLLACRCLPWRPLRRMNAVVDEIIVPLLRTATLAEAALISLLAGVGEELLFRGFLQPLFTEWTNQAWAIGLTAVIFGLAHAITLAYAVLAMGISAYLGWCLLATENLLVPMIAHAVYDFAAILWLTKRSRGQVANRGNQLPSPPASSL